MSKDFAGAAGGDNQCYETTTATDIKGELDAPTEINNTDAEDIDNVGQAMLTRVSQKYREGKRGLVECRGLGEM